MFNCDQCQKTTQVGWKQYRKITQRREQHYTNVIRIQKEIKNPDENYKPRYEKTVKESSGWEIVKELHICPRCYQKDTGKVPFELSEPIVTQSISYVTKPVRKQEHPRRPFKKSRDNRPDLRKPQRKAPVVEVINPLEKRIVKE